MGYWDAKPTGFSEAIKHIQKVWLTDRGERLTQKRLGDIVALDRTSVSNFLRGKQQPKQDYIDIFEEHFREEIGMPDQYIWDAVRRGTSGPVAQPQAPAPDIDPRDSSSTVAPNNWVHRAYVLLWTVPAQIELALFSFGLILARGEDVASPIADTSALMLSWMMVIAMAVWGPWITGRSGHIDRLREWVRTNHLGTQVIDRLSLASPKANARLGVALISLLVAALWVVPDFLQDAQVARTVFPTPSWAAPSLQPLYVAGIIARTIGLADIWFVITWRLFFWIRLLHDLNRDIQVNPQYRHGGWLPPLRLGLLTVMVVGIIGFLAALYSSQRLVPPSDQATLLLERAGGLILYAAGLSLLWMLHEAHSRRSPNQPEAPQLDRAFYIGLFMAIPVAVFSLGALTF